MDEEEAEAEEEEGEQDEQEEEDEEEETAEKYSICPGNVGRMRPLSTPPTSAADSFKLALISSCSNFWQ